MSTTSDVASPEKGTVVGALFGTRFARVVLLFETAMVVVYALGAEYGEQASGTNANPGSVLHPANGMTRYYRTYQDVHVMIFVGFGFLMTFLAKYGFGAVGFNFLLAAISVQWGMLNMAWWHSASGATLVLDLSKLIEGDFAAGAVLITFGALLGKTSPLQLLGVALLEVVVYGLNFYIGAMQLSAVDMGGSLFVHTFGAYFGLAAAWALGRGQRAKLKDHVGNVSSKSSDTFAMIGTLFLWMFWPSFNGALAGATSQHRVIVNTVLSLCGSCVGAFIFSSMFRPGHKFSMVDIQNATLAGGVAVGGASDLVIQPWAALLTGLAASLVSVWGYTRLQGFLEEKVGLFDTCGVHNLHGMPGLIGGLSGVLAAATVGHSVYGANLGSVYPACLSVAEGGKGRTASEQATFQLAATVITVAMATAGGLITGRIVQHPWFEPQDHRQFYSDFNFWDEVAPDVEAYVAAAVDDLSSPQKAARSE